jgi:hypothetical protein
MIRKIITAKRPLKKIMKGEKTNVFIRRGCAAKSSNGIGKAEWYGNNTG